MTSQISWLNGRWSTNQSLEISIKDRGLLLGDGIFETILIFEGKPQLLPEHIERWQRTALLLAMAPPPQTTWLKPLITQAIKKLSLEKNHGALRLNWSRGENHDRGINIPKNTTEVANHLFWLDLYKIEPSFIPISAKISSHERRNANSRISLCKTFAYNQAIYSRQEARSEGYDDSLLLSTNGEICCGSTSNLIVKREDELLTPHLRSGCLPGIMRQQGIDSGLLKEAKINNQIYEGDEWLLINSLSCRPIRKLNNQFLKITSNPKEFWLSLLKASSTI